MTDNQLDTLIASLKGPPQPAKEAGVSKGVYALILGLIVTVGGGFVSLLFGVIVWLFTTQFKHYENTPGEMIALRGTVASQGDALEDLKEIGRVTDKLEGDIAILKKDGMMLQAQTEDRYKRRDADADNIREQREREFLQQRLEQALEILAARIEKLEENYAQIEQWFRRLDAKISDK